MLLIAKVLKNDLKNVIICIKHMHRMLYADCIYLNQDF